MQLNHRIQWYALAISLFVHAVVLVKFNVAAPNLGQVGSGLYVVAQLVDIRTSPVSSQKTETKSLSTPDDSRITATDNSSFKLPTPVNEVDEASQKESQDKPVPEHSKESGNIFTTAGKPDYQLAVLKHIDAHKQYPYRAWRNRIEGSVDISMLVNNDGSATVLTAMSEYPALAGAAKEAIYKAQPLPVPTDDEVPTKIAFTMEFMIRD